MREIVCGPRSPLEGLAGLLSPSGDRAAGVTRLAALAGLVICAALLGLASGWWAFLVVPAYLIAVVVMILATQPSPLPRPTRLLLGIGLPALSLGLIVWLVRLLAGA